MRYNFQQAKFNRGIISPLAFGRVDQEALLNACEECENFQLMRTGPMMYRPGMEDIGAIPGKSYICRFLFAQGDYAILEFTDNKLKIWENQGDEMVLIERVATTSTITNGDFDDGSGATIPGWTDADEGGDAVSVKSSDSDGGLLILTGDGIASAVRYQELATQVNVQQSLRIRIGLAPVEVTLGYSTTGREIFQGTLGPGIHSLSFIPTANVFITLSNRAAITAVVHSVEFESDQVLEFDTLIAEADLPSIRLKQSADIIFVCSDGNPIFEIQRRGQQSWSVVEGLFYDGPFHLINDTQVSIATTSLSGFTTIQASAPLFNEEQWLGVAIRLDSTGQDVEATLSGAPQETADIRVVGIETARKFHLTITGSWTATITLQRSAGGIGAWEDFETYTTNQDKDIDDGLDNSIMHYRVVIKAGDYTSGTVNVNISYPNGSITGFGIVTQIIDDDQAGVRIFKSFGSTSATLNWYRGKWNAEDGYPTAIDLYEGRLVLTGRNHTWHSVSESYRSFDDTVEGDSKSFQRTIGFGPVDKVNWIASFMRLLLGTAGSEVSVRSTAFDTPLTATTANLRQVGEEGSDNVDKEKLSNRVYFVQQSGTRVYEILNTNEGVNMTDMMSLNPEIATAGIVKIIAQTQPDKRLHVILKDGTVVIILFDDEEEIRGFYRVTTDGLIEDGTSLKAGKEDKVFYVVNRGGNRRLQQLARNDEARGGQISKHFDQMVHYTSPGTTLTGLDHLEGETIGVWADGQDRGDFVVASGEVTLSAAYDEVTAGLRYTARYKSMKVGLHTETSTPINQRKKVSAVSFLLKWLAPYALKYGRDFTDLYDLPEVEGGALVDQTQTREDYDEVAMEFEGEFETDSRVCLQATGPVTVLSSVFTLENIEKA